MGFIDSREFPFNYFIEIKITMKDEELHDFRSVFFASRLVNSYRRKITCAVKEIANTVSHPLLPILSNQYSVPSNQLTDRIKRQQEQRLSATGDQSASNIRELHGTRPEDLFPKTL